jgi:hypothetical protein
MKTLIILSAFLLALSSCNKDVPVPDPDPDQVYTSDPGQDPDSDPGQDPDDDPDDGDPSGSCVVSHPGNAAAFSTATHFNDGSKK